MQNRRRILYIALAGIALTACSNADEPSLPQVKDGVAISFSTSMEALTTEKQSRATTVDYDNIQNFKVYAAEWDSGNNFECYIMEGEEVMKGSDGSWTTKIPYYWPTDGRTLSFYAYTPANVDGFILTNHWEAPEKARFYYEPPSNPKNQTEIIFTDLTDKINNADKPQEKVNLYFRHILSLIYFRINGDAKRLESISLSNIYGCGGYSVGAYRQNVWDNKDYSGEKDGFRTSYTIDIPEDGIMGEEQRMIIVPQQTPGDAILEFRFRDGSYRSVNFGWRVLKYDGINYINVTLPAEQPA